MKKKRVLVAMSGGVDSSVAAYLLIKEGYDVSGVTICVKSCDEKTCSSHRDTEDAERVCQILDVPHNRLDFSDEMEEKVIKPFIAEYQKGRTPNPCITCNRHLKFGHLKERASIMGFDYLATGHYARIEFQKDRYILKRPKDKEKDQTYFLYSIGYESLRNIIFPLAEYSKDEVRKIAYESNLPVSSKHDSQDVCFFPSGDGSEFFRSRGKEGIPGDIVDVNGEVIGIHKGIIYYTVGQRRGLGISSKSPLYVISIDSANNRIIAGEKKLLKSSGLIAHNINFFSDDSTGNAYGKIRYAHKPARCKFILNDNSLRVIFDEQQEAITPGQSVVLYSDESLLGGGVIDKVLY